MEITHTIAIDNKVAFSLNISKEGDATRLEFVSFGKYEPKTVMQDGTGLTYIKSRLEETTQAVGA